MTGRMRGFAAAIAVAVVALAGVVVLSDDPAEAHTGDLDVTFACDTAPQAGPTGGSGPTLPATGGSDPTPLAIAAAAITAAGATIAAAAASIRRRKSTEAGQ